MLRSLLAHPATSKLDLDDPRTTILRRDLIRSRPFLRRIYEEWYRTIAAALPQGDEPVLELGSGGGFLSEFVPRLVTSDVLELPGVDRVVDAHRLPFGAGELRGIAMVNVFHHLPDVARFLAEAARCVRPGGAMIMLEPWVTPWSTLIYRKLHHEPFEPERTTWTFESSGALSGANGALPWIVFARDRARLERSFPQWSVESIRPTMPLRYLLSGGVSMRSLMPGFTFSGWKWVEEHLLPVRWTAMFAFITVRRTEA